MTKLLLSRLPLAVTPSTGPAVSAEIYNKTVRLLELSLDSFDPDTTLQFTASRRDELNFLVGTILWNTTESVLQVYVGEGSWENLSVPETSGLSATASVGTVQVVTNGNIVVQV